MKDYAIKFYGSAAWTHCRDAFIKSKGGLCERCAAAGRVTPATIAHHKKYLTPQNIGDLNVSLAWDNLEALCQTCHNIEHHSTPAATDAATRYYFDADGQPRKK